MKHILSFLVLLFAALVSFAETQHFDILLFGDKIGSMTVSHETLPDGTETFSFDSGSKAKILWIVRDNYSHYEMLFKNGRLLSGSYTEKEQGKVSRWGKIQWDGTRYNVENYCGKKSFTENPVYTIASIYFGDVRKAKRIYYDAEAEFVNVEHPDENTIEFKTSDGHRNVYHFVNEKIQSMEFHVSIATVRIVRIN